ncbi:MAG: hypothetical protein GF344_12965, partial [Chitinivibrionales bacterium]|nr:hypothetical protein [Chitinivibrionales bacterium]
ETHQHLADSIDFGSATTGRVWKMKSDGKPGWGVDDAGSGVTAGSGIGVSGNQVSVKFGSNGSHDSVARSDHQHDSRYYTENEADATFLNGIEWNGIDKYWSKIKNSGVKFFKNWIEGNGHTGFDVQNSNASDALRVSAFKDNVFSIGSRDHNCHIIFNPEHDVYQVGIGGGLYCNADIFAVGEVSAASINDRSDERLKADIYPLTRALEKVMELQGVSYTWKEDSGPMGGKKDIGFIAQDIEKVVPEIVSTDGEGYKGIAYGRLTALLTEAVKSQQETIKKLERRVDYLEKRLGNR